MANNAFNSLREFKLKSGKTGKYYSLAALEEAGLGKVSRLPVSLRVVLESVLRNCDGARISEDRVKELAGWQPNAERTQEIPFVLARIMLQDMAGFPALNDFAAMRAEAKRQNFDPKKIEPMVPVDLVVDHSVVIDVHNSVDALRKNMEIEFERNGERYTFLKWAKQAFSGIRVVPPRQRHLPPGQPRIPVARRLGKRRRVLPRLHRRHRFAHHDGQRHRRTGLGRGRD